MDAKGKSAGDNLNPPGAPEKVDISTRPQRGPALYTLERKPFAFFHLFRFLLIPLSLMVTAALALVLLPQSSTDTIVRRLQSFREGSGREQIAFLYLGHRIQNKELQIRGVVRNITSLPIDQLDAAIRLYSHNRDLLETAIVRMDKESIAPNDIARFELVYPNYESEFSSYSVEFKMRRGQAIPYKDMREDRTHTDRPSADSGRQQE